MKHVFSNSGEVAHIWAQNEAGRDGRNGTSNASFCAVNGRQTFYSYREPIAWFLTDNLVVVNSHHWSITTAKHQSQAERAVSHKTVMGINGASPRDTPEELAKKAVEQAIKLLLPIADRSVRSIYKVRWELGQFYRLTGYLGALSGLENAKYNKPIMAMVDRLIDSGLSTAVDAVGTIVKEGHKPQLSQTQAGDLMQATVKYHQHVDADNATDRYLAVMKQAREEYKDSPVNGVLFLERYVVGCNKQLLDKLTKAQVKRIKALYAELRHGAAGEMLTRFHEAIENRDWRSSQHLLDVFAPEWVGGSLGPMQAQVKQIKDAVLTKRLESIMDSGADYGIGHAVGQLGYLSVEVGAENVEWQARLNQAKAELVDRDKAKAAEYIALWRAKKEETYEGKRVSLYNMPIMLRLRAKGKVIETSHGARVPADVANTLWGLVGKARQRSERMSGMQMTVGEYTLDRINEDGSLIIGCHTLPYDELALMAVQLNLNSDSENSHVTHV